MAATIQVPELFRQAQLITARTFEIFTSVPGRRPPSTGCSAPSWPRGRSGWRAPCRARAAMSDGPAIRLKGLTKSLRRHARAARRRPDRGGRRGGGGDRPLELRGKSTLLRCLAGLEAFDSGQLRSPA